MIIRGKSLFYKIWLGGRPHYGQSCSFLFSEVFIANRDFFLIVSTCSYRRNEHLCLNDHIKRILDGGYGIIRDNPKNFILVKLLTPLDDVSTRPQKVLCQYPPSLLPLMLFLQKKTSQKGYHRFAVSESEAQTRYERKTVHCETKGSRATKYRAATCIQA
ncbi:hypothetical protein ARMGADRAFT_385507 [Armillaria gallica]|uniref:Uncharacterized protein n=1 Tax=Armillaria gallica TaxID=47427 RepID=A0A2H3EHR4_ARMGA|nr:hypothetical protein ARMGADRAFT_385507 [Armillaria gallica]